MGNKRKQQKDKYKNHVKSYVSTLESTDNTMTEFEDLDKDTQNRVKQEAYFGNGVEITPSQKAARVRHVENMRLGGFTKREVLYYCQYNWGVPKANATHYYNEALKNFSQDFRENFDAEIDYHLEIRWKLYKEAMKQGRIDSAHKVLQDITKIEGIYEHKPAIIQDDTEFNEVEDYVKEHQKEIEEIRNEDGKEI